MAGAAGEGLVQGQGPTLIREIPAADADNVWLYDPIVLVFSEPLDSATVNDAAISLQVAGKELVKNVELSKDRTTVTLTVTNAPITPAPVTIDVKNTIQAGGVSFAGQTWSWQLPLWQGLGSVTGSQTNATQAAIALDANDQPFVASLESATAPNPLHVSSWDGSAWHNLGDPLNVAAANAASAPSLVVGGDGNPVVAWGEPTSAGSGSIYVAAWSGKAWSVLGGGALGSSGSPVQLALDSKGEPVAAWLASPTELDVQVWTQGAWQPLGTKLTLTADTFHGFAFALNADKPVVAYYDVNQDLAVKSWGGTSWAASGAVIDRQLTTSTGRPSVSAGSDGTLYVGYLDGDAVSSNGYVRSLPPAATAATAWLAQDAALDIVLDAQVTSVDVRASASGPVATWVEAYAGSTKTYVSRLNNAQFQALGPALSASAKPLIPGAALAIDSHGNPNVVYQEQSRVGVERYNASPEAPYGLQARISTAACVLPADDCSVTPCVQNAQFPQTLTATGCYSSVAKQTVIAGALPFEINSPLWSDGATKHRYIVLPDKATIGYTDTGAWLMPVGTIIIKEFGFLAETTDPTSLFPMETRFLVKRCEEGGCTEPWQGYSYQWNTAGKEATLLPATNTASTYVNWPYATNGVPATTRPHRHTYPARSECALCHQASVGRVLGIQTPQFNRSHDYGQTVDNELRALNHLGVFGTTFPTSKLDQIPRLPTPNDVSFSLEQRSRGYFHSNCAHCHNPQGSCSLIDFRFYGTGLTATNICNEIGNATADQLMGCTPTPSLECSKLYARDSARDPAAQATMAPQMPPLATLLPDTRQLAITLAWIQGAKTCP
jgi:Bacterial Ig-like domain